MTIRSLHNGTEDATNFSARGRLVLVSAFHGDRQGSGPKMHAILNDDTGSIPIKIFGARLPSLAMFAFQATVELQHVQCVSAWDPDFARELLFNDSSTAARAGSIIRACDDDQSLPPVEHRFATFTDVERGPLNKTNFNTRVKVIGFETETRKNQWRRLVELADEEHQCRNVTFWNSYALRRFHAHETLLLFNVEVSERSSGPTEYSVQFNVWPEAMFIVCDGDFASYRL